MKSLLQIALCCAALAASVAQSPPDKPNSKTGLLASRCTSCTSVGASDSPAAHALRLFSVCAVELRFFIFAVLYLMADDLRNEMSAAYGQ